MIYYLTEIQERLARWLIEVIRNGQMTESFALSKTMTDISVVPDPRLNASLSSLRPDFPLDKGSLDALSAAGLLIPGEALPNGSLSRYTVTGDLRQAVDSDFATPSAPSSITITHSQIAGGVAGTVNGNQIGGTIHNNDSAIPSLAEAVTEIQNCLKTLEASNPQATESEQIAFLSAMIKPTRRQQLISACQAAGSAAIDEIPYGSVFKALVNGWRNPNA